MERVTDSTCGQKCLSVSTDDTEITTESLWRTAAMCFQPKLLRSETLAWILVTIDA